MGGMGGMPGMGGGGMPDLSALFSDPEIAAAMQNPKMMQVIIPQKNPFTINQRSSSP